MVLATPRPVSLHWKWTPGWLEVKRKVALRLVVLALGAAVILGRKIFASGGDAGDSDAVEPSPHLVMKTPSDVNFWIRSL
jgi:hypothetical protein